MKIRLALFSITSMFLLSLATSSAQAQPATSAQAFDWNSGVVYDFVMNEGSASSNVGLHVDVAKRILGDRALSASAVGEVGLNHFENLTRRHFMGGLRFAAGDHPRYTPFGQLLIGAERCCSALGTNLATQLGGGLDFAWRTRAAVRLQVDWRHVFTDVEDQNGLRVGLGLVLPLSR
ncbi:MAG: hypothetical protein AB7N65_23230 [Vicinamibacterales bacterium]